MDIHKPLLIIRSLFPASLSGLCPFLGDDDNETLNNILACQWNFEEQEFVDTSEEAKDFISRLLIVNKRYLDFVHIHWPLILRKLIIHEVCKNKYCDFVFPISWRMGACEALRHPWLADPALHHRLHTKVKHAFVRVKAFYAGKVLKFVKYVNLVKKIFWMHLIVLYICCGYLFLSYRCTGDYCFLSVSQKTMCRSRRSSCVPNTESWGGSESIVLYLNLFPSYMHTPPYTHPGQDASVSGQTQRNTPSHARPI